MRVFALSVSVLVLCTVGALANVTLKELHENSAACRKEHNVTDQEYELLKAGKLAAADATKDLKCSIKCTMQKSNFMDATGKFDIEAAKQTLASEKNHLEALDKCQSFEDPDICQKAFMYADCIFNHKVDV